MLAALLLPAAAHAAQTASCTSTKPVTQGRSDGWHIRTGAITEAGQLTLRGGDGRHPATITTVSARRRKLPLAPRRAAVTRRLAIKSAGRTVNPLKLTAALTRGNRRGVVHLRLTLTCPSSTQPQAGAQSPSATNQRPAVSFPPTPKPPTGPPPETATGCGSTKIEKPTGGYWTCTFGDDFDGTSLNAGNWQVMSTAMWGFTQAGECYVNDPSTITVANSALTLTANKLGSPAACGPVTSQYQSGMIFTKDRFAQTYGRFEARAKMPTGVGFQPAFWMWPQDMAYGNRSGEIDIAEAFGSHPDIASPHIHMLDAGGVDHGQGNYCQVTNSAGAFHTYTLEWSPTTMTFSYDGHACWTFSGPNPEAPLAAPQPFDKPFFITLQLALGYGVNAVTDSSAFPAKFVVDYVRAWK